jgi:hypothetical protein
LLAGDDSLMPLLLLLLPLSLLLSKYMRRCLSSKIMSPDMMKGRPSTFLPYFEKIVRPLPPPSTNLQQKTAAHSFFEFQMRHDRLPRQARAKTARKLVKNQKNKNKRWLLSIWFPHQTDGGITARIAPIITVIGGAALRPLSLLLLLLLPLLLLLLLLLAVMFGAAEDLTMRSPWLFHSPPARIETQFAAATRTRGQPEACEHVRFQWRARVGMHLK